MPRRSTFRPLNRRGHSAVSFAIVSVRSDGLEVMFPRMYYLGQNTMRHVLMSWEFLRQEGTRLG